MPQDKHTVIDAYDLMLIEDEEQVIVGADTKEPMDSLIPDFSKLETDIIERTLEGKNPKAISISLRVPQAFIRTFLNRPNVKLYIKEVKEAVAQTTQLRLQGILTEVLEAQIDNCESIEKLTRRDPLEVMKLLADISNQIVKQQAVAEETDKYAAILQSVMK